MLKVLLLEKYYKDMCNDAAPDACLVIVGIAGSIVHFIAGSAALSAGWLNDVREEKLRLCRLSLYPWSFLMVQVASPWCGYIPESISGVWFVWMYWFLARTASVPVSGNVPHHSS
eukprot:2918455-Amphidinium_carterae.1